MTDSPASERAIDPVTFSVIWGRFEAIGQEMNASFARTAWSSVLALARDYSCMIYDAHPDGARLITMSDCLPIHTNSMDDLLHKLHARFEGDIREGDVFLTNDPFGGNTHIPDLVAAEPVFIDGVLTFWSIVRGHQIDCGAMEASSIVPSANNIYQEGIVIPPVKIFREGVEQRDIFDLYLANVRFQDALNADLRAQLGAVGLARKGLIALCAKYGRADVLRYVDALIDYADRLVSQEFASFPDGRYEAITWTDTDGVGGVDIPIKVAVTIDKGRIDVDYAGSGPQSAGSANGTLATLKATSTIPFLCYINSDIPYNHGALKHIQARADEGTICLAKFPAATGGATQNPCERMLEAIHIALGDVLPERVSAGSAHTSHIPMFSGLHPETGKAWGTQLFHGGGGQGAAYGCDGWPLFHTVAAMGGLTVGSVEQVEMITPLVIDDMEIEPDSFGSGEWIGGPGIRCSYRPHGEMEAVSIGEGLRNPPHGIAGGTMAPGGGIYIEHADGRRTFSSAAGHMLVHAGERWVGVSPGGGGWGNPLRRDAELVRANLRDGIISEDVARSIFGIVWLDDGEYGLDVQATRTRRAELLETTPARPTEPAEPGAGRGWAESRMTPNDRFVEAPTIAAHFR